MKYFALWTNPEAYGKVYGTPTDGEDINDSYLAMLKERGASAAEIKGTTKTDNVNLEPEEDFDEVKVLRAPPSPNG